MLKRWGYNVLFVVPTNVLVQKYNEAATINDFFGFGIDGNMKVCKFDDSSYDVIAFDEILFSDVSNLRRIKNYVDNNTTKIVVATGDTDQLPPIKTYSNTKEHKPYANECVNLIFPFEIYLHINKRLKTQEDRDKLEQMKIDIFNEDIPIDDIINKYSKFTTDITQSTKNIAYRNETCKNASNAIRNKFNKKGDYEIGEVLICRKYTKVGKHALHVNFEYTIIGISDRCIKIRDDAAVKRNTKNRERGRNVDELPEEFDVYKIYIKENFIFNYCRTCHSTQGSSIEESITIFDYKYEHTTREWLYVAITRATDLNNVYFYKYTENNDLYNTIIKSYFQKKINGYEKQDQQAKRTYDKNNFVNIKWLMSCINQPCSNCNTDLYIDVNSNGYCQSNITADRIDNSNAHHLDNIRPCCYICNCRLGDKLSK